MPDNSNPETPDNALGAKVRESIEKIDLSNSLSKPIRQGIDDLLRVAQETVGSADASVLVRDGREGGLRFLVAVSELEEALLKIRIPPGKGIAGLVFSSGQPMAVNDVSEEGSFWSGADEAVGFKTVTLLATPLRSGNESIGVLEFVNRPPEKLVKSDKTGELIHPPFTPEEMDDAARFADPIARLVDSYELALLVEALFAHSIKTEDEDASGSEVTDWLDTLDAAPEHRDLLHMAIKLREVAAQGDAEREMVRDILDTLARFTNKRSSSNSGYFNF